MGSSGSECNTLWVDHFPKTGIDKSLRYTALSYANHIASLSVKGERCA